jgi:uncharacterized protein
MPLRVDDPLVRQKAPLGGPRGGSHEAARAAPTGPPVVRQMAFEFPDGLDPVFVRGFPEESFFYLGLSLILPHLEPYLIRTMRLAIEQIDDPSLVEQVKRFNGQEGQHYRQHAAYNRALGLLDVPGVAELDAEIAGDFQRFSAVESLQFNLAYAEGFEAATAALGLTVVEAGLLDDMEPASADLWSWHILEELEHRTVAFDVYRGLSGGPGYRQRVALFAHAHLARLAVRGARLLSRAHPPARGRPGARPRRLLAFSRRLVRGFLPRVAASYLPNYTPHDIVVPPDISALAEHFTARAVRAR